MTLNGVIALILRYITEFDSDYVTEVENRPKMSSSYIWPNEPTQHSHGLSATAKPLVWLGV